MCVCLYRMRKKEQILNTQIGSALQQLLLQEVLLQLHGAAISVSYSHSPSSNPSTPEKNEATRCLLPGPWQVMMITEGCMKSQKIYGIHTAWQFYWHSMACSFQARFIHGSDFSGSRTDPVVGRVHPTGKPKLIDWEERNLSRELQ